MVRASHYFLTFFEEPSFLTQPSAGPQVQGRGASAQHPPVFLSRGRGGPRHLPSLSEPLTLHLSPVTVGSPTSQVFLIPVCCPPPTLDPSFPNSVPLLSSAVCPWPRATYQQGLCLASSLNTPPPSRFTGELVSPEALGSTLKGLHFPPHP